MQKSDHQLFTPSRSKQRINSNDGFPQDSRFSQASTYTDQSNALQKSKSLRDTAREFVACFVPRRSKSYKNDHVNSIIQADAASSFSVSGTSTISSSSHSKSKYSGFDSISETQQESKEISISEIYRATGNFSAENIIGQGGFGTVYKGKLKDGSFIAVKRAKKNMYDKHLSIEFNSEIQTLSRVEHLNLVRFLGCVEQRNEQIIVVEYVGNGTLREHLDGTREDVLEIAERLDISIDVAHAVTYLHMYADHPIIHRDIKSSNILLTEKLRAKVADFGFARLAAEDPDATHISTQVKGTAGYLDPEYIRTFQLTEKSDVYSFGVLLVELVTGRHPIERHRDVKNRVTTRWALQKWKEGDAVLAMDVRVRRTPAAIMVVEKVLGLAVECLAPSRRTRPSMKKCAEVLWRIRKDYRELVSSSNLM